IDVPAHVLVLVVHVRLVVLVARDAREHAVVARLGMARLAARPLALVAARVDREVLVMLERGAFPGVGLVAVEAGSREAGVGLLVVVGVAGVAVVRPRRVEDGLEVGERVARRALE